jgi:hypothetical protein
MPLITYAHIDTNILVDILEPDPGYGPISRDALKRCFIDGAVIACESVLADIATAYGNASEKVINELKRIGIEYSAMSLESALNAAECWHRYRQQGGSRSRIAADFLVGGLTH